MKAVLKEIWKGYKSLERELIRRWYTFKVALVNRCIAAGLVVKSKEVKRETRGGYVEDLPLHNESGHVS